MASLLRLTYNDKRPLAIPPNSILTIEAALKDAKAQFPGARSFIRYSLQGQPRAAFLENDAAKTLRRLQNLGIAKDWLSLTQSSDEGGPFYIAPDGIVSVEGKAAVAEGEVDAHPRANSFVSFNGNPTVMTYGICETVDEVLGMMAVDAADQDAEADDEESITDSSQPTKPRTPRGKKA